LAESRVFRVALTGGIGSGKSTVAQLFAALGIAVIDADAVAHALTVPGAPTVGEIVRLFGPGIVDAAGVLHRPALRRAVFADPTRRRRLEELLHPLIRARMLEDLAVATGPYALLVIPLLFETGQTDLADRILVADLPEAEQLRRVRLRSGLDEPEIRRILAAQVSRAERLAGADDVIDNSGPIAALRPAVEALHRRYLDLAAAA
jgi:dephospho-CoA kinase